MTHEELKTRIIAMNLKDFEMMSPHNVARLTDDFCEELIRYIIIRFKKLEEQNKLIKVIKEQYAKWKKSQHNLTWNLENQDNSDLYPKYIRDMDFEIECNRIITEEGSKESFETFIASVNKVFDTQTQENTPSSDTSNLQARIAEKDARIRELEAENETLKKQLAECLSAEPDFEEDEQKTDETVLYNKISFECFLRLLEQAGCDFSNTGNKTRVGTLWHMMTGKSADEIRRFCSSRNYFNNHTKEGIKLLNEHLSDMGINSIILK